MKNETLDAVLDELRRAGVQPTEVSEKGRHIKIKWPGPSQTRQVSVGKTVSDNKAPLFMRSIVRQYLVKDGMVRPFTSQPVKSQVGSPQGQKETLREMTYQINRMQTELEAFSNLFFNLTPHLETLLSFSNIQAYQPQGDYFSLHVKLDADQLGPVVSHLASLGIGFKIKHHRLETLPNGQGTAKQESPVSPPVETVEQQTDHRPVEPLPPTPPPVHLAATQNRQFTSPNVAGKYFRKGKLTKTAGILLNLLNEGPAETAILMEEFQLPPSGSPIYQLKQDGRIKQANGFWDLTTKGRKEAKAIDKLVKA